MIQRLNYAILSLQFLFSLGVNLSLILESNMPRLTVYLEEYLDLKLMKLWQIQEYIKLLHNF
jgi:hypothetical protein